MVREPEKKAGSCTKNGHAGARETGAALIFALLFITVLFSLIGVLFGFSLTATRSVATYRLDRTLRYAADGALEVGIQTVKTDPDLGLSTDPEPCGQVQVYRDTDDSDPLRALTDDSFLRVRCEATPGTTPGGPGEPRDVTLTVTCGAPGGNPDPDEPYDCSDGPQERVLARAQVRFEVDEGAEPSTDQAIVPKIVTWTICRSSGSPAGTPQLCDP